MSTQTDLAAYFRNESKWRAMRAVDYPDDDRNLNAAKTLLDLAQYVEGLDDDDPRMVAVRRYAGLYGDPGLVEISGLEAGLAAISAPASRIGFERRWKPVDVSQEFTWYVEANLAEQIRDYELDNLDVDEHLGTQSADFALASERPPNLNAQL